MLEAFWVPAWPKRLIEDRAYDRDGLDRCLAQKGIEMIAPYRRHWRKPPAQDGRKLRRYRKRWKIERAVFSGGSLYAGNAMVRTSLALYTWDVCSFSSDAFYEMSSRNP